jgi:hypothetical protein
MSSSFFSSLVTLVSALLVVPGCGGDDESRKPPPRPADAAADTTGTPDSSRPLDASPDRAAPDGAGGADAGGDAAIDDAPTGDGSPSDAPASDAPTTGLTGNWLRLAHFAQPHAADHFYLCLAPDVDSDFTLLEGTATTPGVAYGEIGKFVEIASGNYVYRFVRSPDCEDYVRELPSAILTQRGAFTRRTIVATLTDTGELSIQSPDYPEVRQATKDRFTIVDGTNSSAPTIPASLTGAGAPVDFTIRNSARFASGFVDAPHTATLTVTRPTPLAPLTRTIRTMPYSSTFIGLFGATPADWQLTVCDGDEQVASSGHLSACGSTVRN